MQLFHVDRHWPLGPLFLIEADTIAFVQALESLPIDTLMMNKNVFSAISFDKTITFVVIEPFYSAFHNSDPFVKADIQA